MRSATRTTLAVLAASIAVPVAVALAAAPSATTGDATGVDHDSATVHGSVNPQGQATTYHFDFGTTSAYGSQSANTPAGSGAAADDVSATLEGLKASTTYHYRLVASSSQGTTNGADRTFATTKIPPPAATTQPASNVSSTSARLNGSVGPNGQETTYHFEYGTTKAYGAKTSETGAGHGTGSSDVGAAISGLKAGNVYHFRIVATSPGGTTAGGDRSFTATKVPAPGVATRSAIQVGANSARLRGTVNPHGQPTTYHFEFGPKLPYSSHTADVSAGRGTSGENVSAVVSGLAPNTKYHFRIVASGPGGVAKGADRRFTTAKVPLGLTIAAAPNPVVFGAPASVSGHLTGTGSTGRPVVLQGRGFPFSAGWTKLAGPVSTNRNGAFFFGGLKLSLATQLRVVTADNKVVSRPVTVAVAVRVSTHVSKHRIKRHRRLRFAGSIRPAHDGAPFAIQKRKRGRWVTVAGGVTTHRDASSSRYARRIRISRGGRYRVYVRITGGGLTSGTGHVVRLRTFL